MYEDEDKVVPFTIAQRRRIDRTERAVSGYTDEGGIFVPGLLQNTADGITVMKRIKTIAYGIFILAVINSLHLWGLLDVARSIITGGKP